MRIAVDAMGGDFAPAEIVRGAVEAARSIPSVSRLFLVGNEEKIRAELSSCKGPHDKIDVCPATEVIGMEEPPAQAVRRKKDSSISRAVDMVKQGEADAIMSAGNTGAVVVASTLKLRTLTGVSRPAIATVMPTMDRPLLLIDAGANADCVPGLLLEFAAMGVAYSRMILGQKDPVVGLMSIGGEDSKGNEATKEAFRLLDACPLNFRGNVEGHDLFIGKTDVVVCDGFVGNIVLKTAESTAHAIGHWMKQEFRRNPMRVAGAILLKGALNSMKRRMDPELYGGAPLLGVNGTCIIAHGASSHRAIYHAIRVAGASVQQHLNETMIEQIKAVRPAS